MKKITLFFIGTTLLLASSCVSIKKQSAEKTSAGDYVVKIENERDLKLTVVTVDSCEYLIGVLGNSPETIVMTHKGNCKYCLARKKVQ